MKFQKCSSVDCSLVKQVGPFRYLIIALIYWLPIGFVQGNETQFQDLPKDSFGECVLRLMSSKDYNSLSQVCADFNRFLKDPQNLAKFRAFRLKSSHKFKVSFSTFKKNYKTYPENSLWIEMEDLNELSNLRELADFTFLDGISSLRITLKANSHIPGMVLSKAEEVLKALRSFKDLEDLDLDIFREPSHPHPALLVSEVFQGGKLKSFNINMSWMWKEELLSWAKNLKSLEKLNLFNFKNKTDPPPSPAEELETYAKLFENLPHLKSLKLFLEEYHSISFLVDLLKLVAMKLPDLEELILPDAYSGRSLFKINNAFPDGTYQSKLQELQNIKFLKVKKLEIHWREAHDKDNFFQRLFQCFPNLVTADLSDLNPFHNTLNTLLVHSPYLQVLKVQWFYLSCVPIVPFSGPESVQSWPKNLVDVKFSGRQLSDDFLNYLKSQNGLSLSVLPENF